MRWLILLFALPFAIFTPVLTLFCLALYHSVKPLLWRLLLRWAGVPSSTGSNENKTKFSLHQLRVNRE